jgi:hypothetical protein
MGTTVEAFKAKADIDKSAWNSGVASMKSRTSVFVRSVKVGFKSAARSMKQFGAGLGTVAKVGAAGLATATAAVGAMVKKTMDAGDAMDKMSKRTGLNADFLSKMAYAADLSGTSIDVFEKGVKKLQQSASDAKDGLKTYTREFEKLGVSVTDERGNLKSTERLFTETTAALSKMENHTEKAAIASKLFGRAGTQLLPVLADGQKGMAAMMGEAEQLGYVWTNETAKSAADLKDSFSRVWTVAGGMVNRFAVELFPAIQSITDGIVGWYTANRELINGKIVEWAGTLKEGIAAAWTQVKSWAEDGTFMLWWERAKLAALGLKVVMAGVQSSLDYMMYGIYKAMEAKNDLEYLWEGNTKKGYEAARRASEYGRMADEYKASGTNRSVSAVDEYAAQARRVAGASYTVDQRQRAVKAEPTGSGATTIQVNVENKGLQRIENKEADMIAEAVRKRMARGKVKSLAGAR